MTQWKQGIGQRRLWKAEELEGHKPTVYDWVRMAAFLDGEGNLSIYTTKDHRRKTLNHMQTRVLIGNTNPALPAWLKETFGGNIVLRNSQKYNPRAKQAYIWSASSARAVWILHNCLPWFLLKAAQAKVIIQLQEDFDQTRQGTRQPVSQERLALRDSLKSELHKLNAKGKENQVVVPLEKLTGE